MRAYAQGEADEWEPETQQNEATTDSAWNANESRDAWEQASWEEAASWEAEGNQFEGSFADEDEEETFNLAGAHLNEGLGSERNARRTVAQARAITHDIKNSRGGYHLKVQTRMAQKQGRTKAEDKARTDTVVVERRDSRRTHRRVKRNETSQADASISKAVPEMRIPRS